MPRTKTILQADHPYNISARCINRDWFQLPMDQVWEIFSEELYLTHHFFDIEIHSFILMNNHFHMIASTPRANLSECMQYFMKNVSLRLAKAGNRINESFAGRYYKTILHSHCYYLNAYKYNYRNSLIVPGAERVERYKYSTLNGLLGCSRLLIPVSEDLTLFSSVEETLRWLNNPIDPNKIEALQIGLKRTYFRPSKCRSTNRPIIGEREVL